MSTPVGKFMPLIFYLIPDSGNLLIEDRFRIIGANVDNLKWTGGGSFVKTKRGKEVLLASINLEAFIDLFKLVQIAIRYGLSINHIAVVAAFIHISFVG